MEFDCQRCGACCVDYFGTPGYITLEKAEAGRLGRMGLPVVNWHGQVLLGTRSLAEADRPAEWDNEGREERCCVGFTGQVGGACRCTIYADRPAECRAFEVGSLACRFARQAVGLPG
jgi:Fe-S-cluster containining protein